MAKRVMTQPMSAISPQDCLLIFLNARNLGSRHVFSWRSLSHSRVNTMNRPKPSYFRSALDLRDKVQVKVLRKRLKLSDEPFNDILRKSGNSMSAIAKEATHAPSASPGE